MKNSIAFIIVFLICLSLTQCRKDSHSIVKDGTDETSDSIVVKDVSGEVFNLCTDSGIGGISVYLEIYKDKILVEKSSQVSDKNGKFLFKDTQLHSNKAYIYNLYIPSKSGFSAKDRESCGIMGGSVGFDLEKASQFLRFNVIPSFIYLNFYFPRQQTTVASDSIIARFTQNIYHKNVPDYPYQFGDGSTGERTGYTAHSGIRNYPMGLYHIVVDKWVSGVHTQWKDSLYTNYGDTAAYVVHW